MADAECEDDGMFPRGGVEAPRASNLVEIQLRDGVRPEVLTSEGGAACEFAGDAEGFALDGLNRLLREGGCRGAARAFDVSDEEVAETFSLAPRQEVEVPDLRGFYVLHFPEGADVYDIAERLGRLDVVAHAAVIPFTKPACTRGAAIPDDVLLRPNKVLDHDQWYIFRCRVDGAWACGYTGKGVIIADIDWGFVTEHPDIEPRLNMARAFNALDGSQNVSQGHFLGHGTAVLGLAGAAADHNGMVGIAHGAELWPIQVGINVLLDPCPWSRAIFHVLREDGGGRRKVIILEGQSGSNLNITQVAIVRAAVLYAIARGVVVCVPAGNAGCPVNMTDDGKTFEPVGVTVGATVRAGDLPWAGDGEGTNFGEAVVVATPGDPEDDLTCGTQVSPDPRVAYRFRFGATSGATAKVAGAVALMLEANPLLTHGDVLRILRSTGTPVNSPQRPLGNLLDCEAAVLAAEALRDVDR